MKPEEIAKLKYENLLYIQKIFFRMIERNPSVFKADTILHQWKRKNKD